MSSAKVAANARDVKCAGRRRKRRMQQAVRAKLHPSCVDFLRGALRKTRPCARPRAPTEGPPLRLLGTGLQAPCVTLARAGKPAATTAESPAPAAGASVRGFTCATLRVGIQPSAGTSGPRRRTSRCPSREFIRPGGTRGATPAQRFGLGIHPSGGTSGPRRRTSRCPSREFIRPGGTRGATPAQRFRVGIQLSGGTSGPRRRTSRCPSREFIRPGGTRGASPARRFGLGIRPSGGTSGPRRRTSRCPSREFIRPGGTRGATPARRFGLGIRPSGGTSGPRRRTSRCPSRELCSLGV
jgi:hypothetical protein